LLGLWIWDLGIRLERKIERERGGDRFIVETRKESSGDGIEALKIE